MSEDQPAPEKTSLFSIIVGRSTPALFRMVRGEEEFYFDSFDLSGHEKEFEEMGGSGWKLENKTELPSYLQARLRTIKELGLVPFEWGYKKK